MSHWHLFERNVIRETVDGIKGFRCECGHWEPIIRRSDDELAERIVTAPAHERYAVSKAPARKLIRFGRNK